MTIKKTRELVEDEFNVDISDKSQKIQYIKSRAMYYYLCMRYATDALTLRDIANEIDKDHATVINGLKTFESFMVSDKTFVSIFDRLKGLVKTDIPNRYKNTLASIESMYVEKLKGELFKAKIVNQRSMDNIRKLRKRVSELKNKK